LKSIFSYRKNINGSVTSRTISNFNNFKNLKSISHNINKKQFLFEIKKIMLFLKKFIFANNCLNTGHNFLSFGELLSNFGGLRIFKLDRDPSDSNYSNQYLICGYYIKKNELIGRGASAKVFKALKKDTCEEYVNHSNI